MLLKNCKNFESFETQRLSARRIQTSDFDEIFRLHNDPAVAETLGGNKTEPEIRNYLANYEKQWEKYGYGYWMFFIKDTSEFIGRGGLRHVPINNNEEVEIGFAVKPKFWNKGYATEMGKTAIEVASLLPDIDNLVCFTVPSNKKSQAVMKRLGFLYEGDFEYQDVKHVLYRLKVER